MRPSRPIRQSPLTAVSDVRLYYTGASPNNLRKARDHAPSHTHGYGWTPQKMTPHDAPFFLDNGAYTRSFDADAYYETTDATLTESLSAVDNTDDPRSESMKISMAEHFSEFEHEYREDPHTDAEVVFEDDQLIVVADHTGHELSEWVSDFNMTEEDCDAFCTWNHEVARELTDHDWSVVDPVVFDKLGNATTDATLTEHLSAARNTDDSIDGAAKITHTQNGKGVWQIDDGERLEDDPDEYRVECSCGESFDFCGLAIYHVEEE